jgi:hypothetical protein
MHPAVSVTVSPATAEPKFEPVGTVAVGLPCVVSTSELVLGAVAQVGFADKVSVPDGQV